MSLSHCRIPLESTFERVKGYLFNCVPFENGSGPTVKVANDLISPRQPTASPTLAGRPARCLLPAQPWLGDLQGGCTGVARPVLHHRRQPQTDHRALEAP